MTTPKIAQKGPYQVAVEAGKKYFWCACGRSATHKDTGFTPVKYEAERARTLYFCGCKQTAGVPLCDGTHNKL